MNEHGEHGHSAEHLQAAILRALERYQRQHACPHATAGKGEFCPECGKKLRLSQKEKEELRSKIRRILIDEYDLAPKRNREPRFTQRDRQLLKRLRIQL